MTAITRVFLGAAASLLLAAFAAPAAQAEFGIASFDGEVLDAADETYTQAGGHPDRITVEFTFNQTTNSQGAVVPDGQVKDIDVELPPGLVGDPTAVPRCSQADFSKGATGNCPAASQIGTNTLLFNRNPSTGELSGFTAPVYNLEPRPGVVAEFGFRFATNTVPIEGSIRTGEDYGVTMSLRNIPQALGLFGNSTTFWGVPANQNGGGAEPEPFLTLPTSCPGPVTTTLRATSWQDPDRVATASFVSHDTGGNPVGTSGCELLEFAPSITAQPTTTTADSPTGLEVELTVPQSDDPAGLASAHLKRAEVTLPEGMALNPAAANGLAACSPAEIGLDRPGPASCPNAAKLGTVEIETPLLDEPLTGAIYQAEQGNIPGHGRNPFGSLLAIYLVAEGSGARLKLAGEVSPDPRTGQLTATFDDNPQLPFTTLRLRFFGGPGAALVNPPTCGTKQVTAELSPWSAADPEAPTADEVVTAGDSFAITSGPNGLPCAPTPAARPFDPGLSAGLVDPVAGSASPFVLRLTREDGHQEILSTEVSTPPGVSAILRGIPLCGEAEAAAGSCPAGSRVGRSVVGAGAGPSPFYIRSGEVFLAGPYKGAPLSLVIEVPAVAGPLDLGEVVIRAAVHVDPRTAQLRVVSDPIPRILEGIPLRVRDIRLILDRPGFTIAPTSCAETQVTALVRGSDGGSSNEASRFQVGNCGQLGFKPRLRFKATGGRKATRRNAHPGLEARLTLPGGAYDSDPATAPQANVARVEAVLPKGMLLDQNSPAFTTICTRAQYAAEQCPESTRVGTAIAHTPLLDQPLTGPVYLKASDNVLPDLAADLEGTVDIDLFGRIDQKRSRIRNTFDVVPDVPVSEFVLRIEGGRDGILVNSKSICAKGKKGRKRRKIDTAIESHSGAAVSDRQKLKAKCPKRKRR